MYCNIKDYTLRYTDVDFNDYLKLSSLLSVMEESACASADELGFGYSVLQPQKIGFILSNWYLELFRPIKLGDVLSVHTWPIKPGKIIALRDFELYVGEEKVGVATSRWCLVDLNSFSMLNTSFAFPAEMTYNENRAVDFVGWKIPRIADGRLAYVKAMSYSDYDHYNHVNNTRYGDFLMDVFSVEEMRGRAISSVQVSYIKQCKYGDRLEIYREDLPDGHTLIEGRVADEVRVQMKITLL